MSADNILIILHHRGKVRVHDVNFSDISSHEDWGFPVTPEKSHRLASYILGVPHYVELHKCDTVAQAEGFCRRYMRTPNVIVEYDFGSIVCFPDGSTEVAKSKKGKAPKKDA